MKAVIKELQKAFNEANAEYLRHAAELRAIRVSLESAKITTREAQRIAWSCRDTLSTMGVEVDFDPDAGYMLDEKGKRTAQNQFWEWERCLRSLTEYIGGRGPLTTTSHPFAD